MELTDFLQVKKSEGYCIVGVEQTANSQSLQDYQFPEKTLLLLGYDIVKHSCPFFPPHRCVNLHSTSVCLLVPSRLSHR